MLGACSFGLIFSLLWSVSGFPSRPRRADLTVPLVTSALSCVREPAVVLLGGERAGAGGGEPNSVTIRFLSVWPFIVALLFNLTFITFSNVMLEIKTFLQVMSLSKCKAFRHSSVNM